LWWKFLDESYFGPDENQDDQTRLECLSEPQRNVMDSFVARKMEDSSNRLFRTRAMTKRPRPGSIRISRGPVVALIG
jgi:hypothetical protein